MRVDCVLVVPGQGSGELQSLDWDYLQTRAQQAEVSLIILTTPLNFATKLNIYLRQINMTSSFIILMMMQKSGFLNVWIAQQNSGHFKDHKYVKCIVGNDGIF